MKKIAVIPPIPLTGYERSRRENQYRSFADPGFRPDIRILKGGPLLTDTEEELKQAEKFIIAEAAEAVKEGASAVIVDCTADTGLYEIRNMLAVPAAGALEASLALAIQTNRKYSVLALDDSWAGMIEKRIPHWFREKLVSVESVGMHVYTPDSSGEMNSDDFSVFFNLLSSAAERAAGAGAEALILGSTTVIRGWKELESSIGIPVTAPGIAAFKTAEILVKLGAAGLHSPKT